MKTIYFILIALFMTASFTSCTADNVADNDDISLETEATNGENGHIENQEADEEGN